MKKRTKKVIAVVTACMLLATCLVGCGGSNDDAQGSVDPTRISFASGGTSGTYFPIAGAISDLWNKNVEGLTVDVQATGASAENLNLLNAGNAEVAFVQNDVMYYAYTATESFANVDKNESFLTLGTVYPEVVQLVVAGDSGIESLADLKGKSVSIGDLGSGVESNAKQILAAAGISLDDITVRNLGFGESANGIKDKTLDAAFVTAGTPTTAVTELAATNDIRILSLDQDVIDQLCTEYAYYTPFTIPAHSAEVYNLDNDVNTIAVKATIVVSANLSEDLVYNMTKSLFENLDAVAEAHAKGKEMSLEGAIEGVSVPLHPGAAKYYAEQGLNVE